eukprot:TRINITY_DN11286_c0_g1_i1.p1 TRINITY_DN11286_c0_g1~~TRINITY_DN11286_c0_g1_i1.p1  ORF type:complete len:476 (+),score=141.88 TRINITY_DN11286_c0_g1_i1:140-1567(+)
MPTRRTKAKKNVANASNGVQETKKADLQEKLLTDVNKCYVDPKQVHDKLGETGLVDMAKELGSEFLPPRKRMTCMLIGNHSAGKSTFINWYIEDQIQKTSVAIETRGFTVVTSGDRKEEAPITGDGTLMMFPHLKGLEKYGKGFIENLCTQVSISQSRDFPLVDFIDTPGLVDGKMLYAFDVNNVIIDMADHVDLIFVFLDPIGQALCTRTMDVLKALNKEHYSKMRYFLSKADRLDYGDLQKVTAQIAMNIRPVLHDPHGFELPAIAVPFGNKFDAEACKSYNQLNVLCKDIRSTIKQRVQRNLTEMHTDCNSLLEDIDTVLAKEKKLREKRRGRMTVKWMFLLFAWLFVVPTMMLCLFHQFVDRAPQFAASEVTDQVLEHTRSYVDAINTVIPSELTIVHKYAIFFIAFFVSMVCGKIMGWFGNRVVVRGKHAIKRISSNYRQVIRQMLNLQESMHKTWLEHQRKKDFSETSA